MIYQVILIDQWQLESEALNRENNFWFAAFFFAICQIIPLKNEGFVAKAWTI